ncbi:hypothetical protein L1987_48963 [Smallanthus sonchifolius]|uniref:Uncharacterized protein n=1 Tax=Smallanthus sonchifolius TaxID=185202 RepID=A0ACB9FUE9_9ASTR|nr:hypothetical protein L1987_48963 [Smallanthus sonchifolius]
MLWCYTPLSFALHREITSSKAVLNLLLTEIDEMSAKKAVFIIGAKAAHFEEPMKYARRSWFSETSGGVATSNPFAASAGGADDDGLYMAEFCANVEPNSNINLVADKYFKGAMYFIQVIPHKAANILCKCGIQGFI